MRCVICGHKPSGHTGDEQLIPMPYMIGFDYKDDNLCRTCHIIMLNTIGHKITELIAQNRRVVSE